MDSLVTRRWVLIATSGALAMTFIDETGVGVALTTIRSSLHTTGPTTHWVVNAYMVALAALVAAGGRLSDQFGHRRVFLAGLAGFAAGSALCSAAPDAQFLIAARAVQGIGAAMLIPTTLALLTDAYAAAERGRAVGIYIGAASVFYVVGPVVAGILTQFVSWRALFWVNLPAAVAIAVITLRQVAGDRQAPEVRQSLDPAGLATLVTGLGLVVLALMNGPAWGWGSPASLIVLVAGCAALAAFVRVERANPGALFELDLFANRVFSAGTLIVFLVYVVYLGVVIFVPLFLQHEAGLGPAEASLALVAALGPITVTAPLAGRLRDRYGARRPAIASAIAGIVSFSWLALALPAHDLASLIPALVIYAFSVPMLYTISAAVTQNAVAEGQRGQASGIIATAAQTGAAVGVAVLGAIALETSEPADYTTRGFQAVFFTCAALAAVMAALAAVLPGRARSRADVARPARRPAGR